MEYQHTDDEAPVTLLALKIIDLATSWFVIIPLPKKMEMKPLQLNLINNGFGNTLDLYNASMTMGQSLWVCSLKKCLPLMLCTSIPITDSAATKFCVKQQLHATQWAIDTAIIELLKHLLHN